MISTFENEKITVVVPSGPGSRTFVFDARSGECTEGPDDAAAAEEAFLHAAAKFGLDHLVDLRYQITPGF